MSRDRDERDFGASQPRRVSRRKRVYSRPISVPPGSAEVIRNPVHTRVELRSVGDPVAVDMVFCKREGQSLPLSSCAGCDRAVSLPDLSKGESSVTCHGVGPLTSRDADLVERSARVPLAELGRRKFACVRPDTGWETMEALLLDDGMGALPVVDEDGRPMGIVSKSDLMRWARDGTDEVTATELPHATHVDTHPNATAGDIMTPVVHALPEDAPLSFAIALLAMENVDQVPILSEQGEVVGLFAARDAVRWLAQELGYVVRSPGD
jgi:CBS domain-containing protein